MEISTDGPLQGRLDATARETRGLDLLIVFGSRATGREHPGSDWDFGFLSADGLDEDRLLARLVEAVGYDKIDLVDLRRAGGLLRYRAAREGEPLYEARPGIFEAFRLEAVRFWCDAEPVLRRGYEAVLERMGP